MRYDFFYRREGKNFSKSNPAICLTLDIDTDDLAEAIKVALESGMSKGSARSGCFEVQTDEGIWSQVDGNRIDLSTPRRREKVVFKTWDQLESEEMSN